MNRRDFITVAVGSLLLILLPPVIQPALKHYRNELVRTKGERPMFRCLIAMLTLAALCGLTPKADAGIFTVRTGLGDNVILVDDFNRNNNFLLLNRGNPSITVVGARGPIFPLVNRRGGAVILNGNNFNVLEVQQRGLFGRRTVIRVR